MHLQNLNALCKKRLSEFIHSFDYVFLDIDGVLVKYKTCIPGSVKCVLKLRQLKKNVGFVTNNGVYSLEAIKNKLSLFEVTEDEIVTPYISAITYLKSINFDKDIFVIGSSCTKKLLREAGFKVIDLEQVFPGKLEETIAAFIILSDKVLVACKNVGAVLLDFSLHFSLAEAQAAMVLLKSNEDILLFSGATDDSAPISENCDIIGPKFYIDGIERWTERKCIEIAKPGLILKDVLLSKFSFPDPKRVLFIGDSVKTDIAFGKNCGFQTLLVLSGTTKEGEIEEWKYPEAMKPNYYIKDLGHLIEKIEHF